MNERKLKFKAWCQAKVTTKKKAFMIKWVKARIARKAVAQAQQAERKSLRNKINSEEGQSSVFKRAKQMTEEDKMWLESTK